MKFNMFPILEKINNYNYKNDNKQCYQSRKFDFKKF